MEEKDKLLDSQEENSKPKIIFIISTIVLVFAGIIYAGILLFTADHSIKIPTDVSTYSNIEQINTKLINFDWEIDFEKQMIKGRVDLTVVAMQDGINQVCLDTYNLTIKKVYDANGNNFSKVELRELAASAPFLGQPLWITLNSPLKATNETIIKIEYETAQKPMALSWIKKENTLAKTLPMVFSQCEPIYCRSLAPLQDSPSIKSKYTATVRVPRLADNFPVFMSAITTNVQASPQYLTYKFESPIPIPSYGIAITAGAYQTEKISSRVTLIAENISLYKDHLAGVGENLLVNLEKYMNIPYPWSLYQIVVLPASFPYGGMENPLLTFVHPLIFEGKDKSGLNVVVHEMAHS